MYLKRHVSLHVKTREIAFIVNKYIVVKYDLLYSTQYTLQIALAHVE